MTSLPVRRAFAAGIGVAALTATLIAGASPAAAKPKPNPGPPRCRSSCWRSTTSTASSTPPTGSSSTLPGFPDPDGRRRPLLPSPSVVRSTWRPRSSSSRRQSQEPNTLTVAAGDLIGASPLLSAAYHDEPTIEALNLMGLDYAARRQPRVRRGRSTELLRMQNGGCLAEDSCSDG